MLPRRDAMLRRDIRRTAPEARYAFASLPDVVFARGAADTLTLFERYRTDMKKVAARESSSHARVILRPRLQRRPGSSISSRRLLCREGEEGTERQRTFLLHFLSLLSSSSLLLFFISSL